MPGKKTLWVIVALAAALVVAGAAYRFRIGEKIDMAVRDITPRDAMRRIEAGDEVVLLDVRTPAEFAEKRIPGSVNLPIEPVDEVTAKAATVIPDKRATVYVYCRSGRRSRNAVEALQKLGYRNAHNLGGVNDWPYATEGGPAPR